VAEWRGGGWEGRGGARAARQGAFMPPGLPRCRSLRRRRGGGGREGREGRGPPARGCRGPNSCRGEVWRDGWRACSSAASPMGRRRRCSGGAPPSVLPPVSMPPRGAGPVDAMQGPRRKLFGRRPRACLPRRCPRPLGDAGPRLQGPRPPGGGGGGGAGLRAGRDLGRRRRRRPQGAAPLPPSSGKARMRNGITKIAKGIKPKGGARRA